MVMIMNFFLPNVLVIQHADVCHFQSLSPALRLLCQNKLGRGVELGDLGILRKRKSNQTKLQAGTDWASLLPMETEYISIRMAYLDFTRSIVGGYMECYLGPGNSI